MKIAVVTDDQTTLTAHFGRARYFLVFTVEDQQLASSEVRDKRSSQDAGCGHDHSHDHDHEHERSHRRGQRSRCDPREQGDDGGAHRRHAGMIAALEDCDVVLARGMGQGAYLALLGAGIRPITTQIKSIEDAVYAYVRGETIDCPERRH